jgi:hypothetical protein
VKKKNLREEVMSNANRQIYGMSNDEPFVQIAIPVQQQMGQVGGVQYPFEIGMFKQQIFEIFEKVMILRNQFDAALNNPSVSDSERIALEKSVKRLDKINSKLIEVPDFLSIFEVD